MVLKRTTPTYIMNVNDQKSKWFIFSLLIWILIIFSSIFYSTHVKRSSNYVILNVLLQFSELFMQNVLHYKWFQFFYNRKYTPLHDKEQELCVYLVGDLWLVSIWLCLFMSIWSILFGCDMHRTAFELVKATDIYIYQGDWRNNDVVK